MLRKLSIQILTVGGLIGIAAPHMAAAQVSGFDLGSMGGFAVVIDNVSNFQLTSDSGITGSLGIGSMTGSPQFSGGSVSGAVAFASATLPNGVTAGTPGSGTGGTQGSIAAGVASVGSAISTMSTLSSYYVGQTGTTLSLNLGNSSTTVNVETGTKAANGSAYVFDVGTSFNVTNGGTITISGSASDYVVFNFAASSTLKFNDSIVLAGGITSDHVLFDYTGTNQISSAANGAYVYGVLDAPNAALSLDNIKFDGRIMAGKVNTNSSIQSGAYVTQPTTYSPPASVPEPRSVVLLLVALGGLAWVKTHRLRYDRL
ncbi:MAG: hypothetical protein P4L90_12975 [Rhodopila sp.]|nr:hypothetical protein [Rhodopila sp.]